MTRNINEAADHYYDRLLAEQDEAQALADWLERNNMTMEQYAARKKVVQEDQAADAAFYRSME